MSYAVCLNYQTCWIIKSLCANIKLLKFTEWHFVFQISQRYLRCFLVLYFLKGYALLLLHLSLMHTFSSEILLSISYKFNLACRTGVIFLRFSGDRDKREASAKCESRATGRPPLPVARDSHSTLASLLSPPA